MSNNYYSVDDFRKLVAYSKAIEVIRLITEDQEINGLDIRNKNLIRKTSGKVAAMIARGVGNLLYINSRIYFYKEAINYTYKLERVIKELGISNKEEYSSKLLEIRKLLFYYIKIK